MTHHRLLPGLISRLSLLLIRITPSLPTIYIPLRFAYVPIRPLPPSTHNLSGGVTESGD